MIHILLLASLSDKVFPLVLGKRTSCAIWDTLSAAFSSPSESRIMSLTMALQELNQKPDEPVANFLKRAKTIAEELAVASHIVRPSAFNLHIYRGLKPEFGAMVSSLLTRTEPVLYDDLHAMLLSHEFLHGSTLNKLNVADSPPANAPTANTAQRLGSDSDSTTPTSQRRGRGRGGRGRGGSNGGISSGRFWCAICRKTNHSTNRCYF
ncbi:uncharacterized protein LOC122655202 [Telopea speciosissima]|uniref:uncharacterized protein LOC122655202 n=1 Tax=Telopea speciosissima TaxID=54955 RepID=UPI001CC6D583|nr:uncharacterized protein LOC122655202 [Telopea speciosissima]